MTSITMGNERGRMDRMYEAAAGDAPSAGSVEGDSFVRMAPHGPAARVYSRLRRWADAGRGNTVVLAWGLLQGLVFPGVADLFFLPLAIARPERAYRLALVATTGTLIGSIVLYWVGAEALAWLQGPVSRVVDMTPADLDAYRERLAAWGGWAIFASTMSPLSTKLTSIASGAAGVPFATFTAALLAGRLTRTFVFAWIVRNGRAKAVERWVGTGAEAGERGGS
ncbi:YqaA family protein [Gemmatimonas sp.]